METEGLSPPHYMEGMTWDPHHLLGTHVSHLWNGHNISSDGTIDWEFMYTWLYAYNHFRRVFKFYFNFIAHKTVFSTHSGWNNDLSKYVQVPIFRPCESYFIWKKLCRYKEVNDLEMKSFWITHVGSISKDKHIYVQQKEDTDPKRRTCENKSRGWSYAFTS